MDSKLSRWCDGLIEAGWLAAVIAAPLFFNIHSDRVFEPDKLTLVRSIALVMLAAWLVGFIDRQGWRGWRYLSWRHENSVWRMPFVLPVFLLTLVYLLSSLFSVTPRVSWAGSYQRLQGTYTTLAYIVIFSLTAMTMRSRAQLSRVVTAVIITSIPVSFYGLLQHFGLDPLPWGGDVTTRVAGHMGNAIFIGAYLIMAVPLTVARIIDAFTRILGDEELSQADVVRSSVYIFALAIQLIAIYWSGSRGPWIGLAAALFAFLLIVLVTLRDAAPGSSRFQPAEAGKALALVLLGTGGTYAILRLLVNGLAGSGRFPALEGAGGSFAAFAGAIALVVITIFVMIAARRGWRWLWSSWLLLTLLLGGWLAAFNFAPGLNAQLSATPVLGHISETLLSWRDLSTIGRLGRLLESDSGTGKVRVLIWQGVLDLISLHEPLQLPDGEQDRFNFLRPLLGYGPESMYVAYNRFYPPELATVEARNASPDRSHNETFDALVITGGLGFLAWQALYLSVFYHGFRWLGVLRRRRDRNLLIVFWITGAAVASLVVTRAMGLAMLGVAIPLGSIIGLVVYLVYYALFIPSERSEGAPADPFQIDRLLMIGLVAAVLAHYVEIHFGIAIASSRVHFFVYVALMFILGYWLPQLKSVPATPLPARVARRGRRRSGRGGDGIWGPVLLSGLMLALIIGIMGYEYVTFSLPPDVTIESPADLTAGDIFRQSFLQNASLEFADSPFLFVMMILTWSLGALVIVSEMVKQGELRFLNSDGRLQAGRRQVAAAVFLVGIVAGLAYRFWLSPPVESLTTTPLLGRSLVIIWIGLCAWAVTRLLSGASGHRLLGGAVAMAGLLFSLPLIVAGGTWPGLIIAAFGFVILYLLWDGTWSTSLLPAALLSLLSLGLGLFFAYLQASLLRATLFFQAGEAAASLAQARLAEAEQSTIFLTMFYVGLFVLLLLSATAAAWNDSSRLRQGGSAAGYVALLALLLAAVMVVDQSNMRIIQADVIYKRAKPFDANASQSRDPQLWEVAIAIYERALELVPKEDFYYLFLGRAYLEQSTVSSDLALQNELLNRAEVRLLEAQEINPLNTDHTANLARLNTRWVQLSSDDSDRQLRLQRAESYYQAALALSPQNSIIRNEYARLAYDLKQDCDQAIALYDESVQIDPYFDISFFGRAEIYQACAPQQSEANRQGYLAKAADSFESGLRLDDREIRVWLQLAQVYQQLGRYQDALDTFAEAETRNDNQIAQWNLDYWRATVYFDMGDEATAETLGRRALESATPDGTAQIQAFLSQFTEAGQLPEPAEGTRQLWDGDRPLADVPVAARDNYYSRLPPLLIDTSHSYEAIFQTEKGEMRFQLFDDAAPLTVNNFVFLASQGFYDGTTFHRVLQDFMAQGGDPSGSGAGGPGYEFEDELAAGYVFDRPDLLAMANAGVNTNGSQFFITFVPTPHLNGRHTIFGRLLEGDETLAALTLRDPQANPTFPGDLIERIDIVEITP